MKLLFLVFFNFRTSSLLLGKIFIWNFKKKMVELTFDSQKLFEHNLSSSLNLYSLERPKLYLNLQIKHHSEKINKFLNTVNIKLKYKDTKSDIQQKFYLKNSSINLKYPGIILSYAKKVL